MLKFNVLSEQKRELTSKLKIQRNEKKEYRDDIKCIETRLGWEEAHCVGRRHTV